MVVTCSKAVRVSIFQGGEPTRLVAGESIMDGAKSSDKEERNVRTLRVVCLALFRKLETMGRIGKCQRSTNLNRPEMITDLIYRPQPVDTPPSCTAKPAVVLHWQ